MAVLRFIWVAVVLLVAAGCEPTAPTATPAELAELPWDSIVQRARGEKVVWRMWRGDPSINAYIDGWVAPRLRELYDIELVAVDGSGPELVNQLATERSVGASGTAGLVWINGETFHNLRSADLLWGPWSGRLPNAMYVDSSSAIITRDFGEDPMGYESPWGRVQFALIYDTLRTPDPPQTVDELGDWILANPGRFTHDQQFTGVTFLKILLYSLNGGYRQFDGGFEEDLYLRASEQVWDWVAEHRNSFWREGRVYPMGVADLHRLFANGEVDFTMSNNDSEVAAKVQQGVLPPSSRALILRDGTIANTHYVGIPFNAPAPAASMVIANFLLSPEAQLQKLQPEVWADGTVLGVDRLPADWARRFRSVERDPRVPPADTLSRYAVPEVSPIYHERLAEDWRRLVRQAQ